MNHTGTNTNTIEVVEYHQELSARQKEIQSSIAVLVMQCLRQLKQQTEHLVQWSVGTTTASTSDDERDRLSSFTVENCVTQQFDIAISRQLESQRDHDCIDREALSRKNDPTRVYFLMFEASAEEKNYEKALEREQNAFERLIHHKKTMPVPVIQSMETQEMQEAMRNATGVAGTYMNGQYPLSVDTRRGKGKLNTSKEALPNILHQGGMRLAPVTLTVGDFVLSNVHCVERKSISDLFGSFASGRLYTQAEAMSKYYACPCLLIEFDPNKSFCLQNSNELGVDVRIDSVCSKMVLWVTHFPKLRIL